ncbi:MFS transporter [Vitreoscilla stercoraria]|uniref:MFS transporter n=1 Tax=Vitreoscilla stercoraria TaxID=61 RepID=A0ABY4EBN9_VITST|nr:MFS transporter [Vitreoscilla stercoraria]UOO92825.1 MFS transporter [Vitreoscilla stercoraria]
MFSHASSSRSLWYMVLAATLLLLITMGVRNSLGLYVLPISEATSISIASISLALAIGQFLWGAIQPVAGAIADKFGPRPVLVFGMVVLLIGLVIPPLWPSEWGMMVGLGILSAIGSGIGSFSIMMGAVAQHITPQMRGNASGIMNAGSSLGQVVVSPLTQSLIKSIGWMQSMFAMAALTVATIPLLFAATRPYDKTQAATAATADGGLKQTVLSALRNRDYLLIHLGFFTCGFHIAFLVTHLPGEVAICGLNAQVAGWSLALIGLANVAGSLLAGRWVSRYRSKYILFWMYLARAVMVLWFINMPREPWVFYVLAVGLGFTFLATVPPTASLVGKLFGVRYLATLFGLTLFSHQVGGFLGAYLGGLSITEFGDYRWMWYADMVLAAVAALIHLPIREAKIEQTI